jgi:hypothetical protein
MKILDFTEKVEEKSIPAVKYSFSDDIELKDSEDEHENGLEYANSDTKRAQVTDLDDDLDSNSKSSATNSQSTIKSKFKDNIMSTLSKLNLKMSKLGRHHSSKAEPSPEVKICRRCSKQIHPLHISKRVLDLTQLSDDDDDISSGSKKVESKPCCCEEGYCECENGEGEGADDDAISINVHTYCDVDGVSIT